MKRRPSHTVRISLWTLIMSYLSWSPSEVWTSWEVETNWVTFGEVRDGIMLCPQCLCFKITSENPSTDHRGWPTKTISVPRAGPIITTLWGIFSKRFLPWPDTALGIPNLESNDAGGCVEEFRSGRDFKRSLESFTDLGSLLSPILH